MKRNFVKLLKRYWRYVRHKGVANTQRNKWIAGNLVGLHCDFVPKGSALVWGDTDRKYSNVSPRGISEEDFLFSRAVNAALDRDWNTEDGPTLHPMLENFANWNFQGVTKA